MDQSLQAHGVTLVAADLDESPMAYPRRPEVLGMAGEGGLDPFED